MVTFNKLLVIKTLGFLLFIESIYMSFAGIVAWIYKEPIWQTFLLSIGITAGTGLVFFLIGKKASEEAGRRESFFIVATIWIIFSFFGLLPFYLSNYIPDFTNAYFEVISGFTTTGASVLDNIEFLPKSLLFWRSILQWLGGIGIIVVTLVLLPFFGGSGMHLYRAEVPGITYEKIRPRIKETAQQLWLIYLGLTFILFLLLWLGPMEFFDAVCHSLTTVSTGGFSTKQESILFWDSAYIEYILIAFMFLGGTNFIIIYHAFHMDFKRMKQDDEFKWYIWTIGGFTFVVFMGLLISQPIESGNIENTFRDSFFQVTSIITSSGFSTSDYISWGPFFWILMLMLMVSGACAGSTSGGMKIVRSGTLVKNILNEFNRQIHPRAILPVRINKIVIPQDVMENVMIFALVYVGVLVISTLLLTISGVGFEESIGSVISCVGNTGPGLGQTGPSGSYASLPVFAKWVLCFDMIVGRLELFTLLIIFLPGFWKK
ncbi:MAG: TrkH family potassium uptake protein [Candidatus Azobacteroides sp.]|nr:TrkH family potassium uptake protein [Candidatus Azobacteroides sp.]